jgi:hypothetical protein
MVKRSQCRGLAPKTQKRDSMSRSTAAQDSTDEAADTAATAGARATLPTWRSFTHAFEAVIVFLVIAESQSVVRTLLGKRTFVYVSAVVRT